MLFSKEYAYLELMLPSTLLKGTTVITELIKIDESNFLDDVEVIGWLYQFYVSSDREEFRKAKVVNKDLIPTLTQIFTPDWIVRYMTENSLGRLWLESYPDSSVKKEFKYYVEDAEQTEEVKKQIESIRYKNVNPKDIKVIEPCSGSGHILVYAFDVLLLMYEEKGYSKNDIPKLILDNNLFGLDVDKRASQLASFSLVMKARSIDSRFFQSQRISYPKVFEIKDSKMLISMDYKKKLLDLNNNDWNKDEHLDDEELKVIDYVIETFVDGKVIGSLLKVKRDNYVPLISKINHLHKVTIRGIFNGEFVEYGLKRIVQLLRLAEVMSRKYDVLITNPPYVGSSKLEKTSKEYLYLNYPNSKDDMFAMFMEVTYSKLNGFKAIVNPDSWMFIQSYEKLRKSVIENSYIVNMAHIGLGAFDAVVQNTTFVSRQTKNFGQKGVYLRLIDVDPITRFHFDNYDIKYEKAQSIFLKVPQAPIAYWLSERLLNNFEEKSIAEYVDSKAGVVTGDDNYFIRYWYETKFNDICLSPQENVINKYNLYQKGGPFRRYYGNNLFVIKTKDLFNPDLVGVSVRRGDRNFYFKEGIGWSYVGSNLEKSFRIINNSICGTATPMLYFKDNKLQIYALGLLNSVFSEKLISFLNPTLNLLVTDIARIPFKYDSTKVNLIIQLVNENIEICKNDWDDFETSIDFVRHPLLTSNFDIKSNVLEMIYSGWKKECDNRFFKLKSNEEQLNKLFISIYGMEDELNYEVSEKKVSVSIADTENSIITLVSYFVGVLFNRYSLEHQGIYFAGEIDDKTNFDSSTTNRSVIQVYNNVGMTNGLDSLFLELIKEVFGSNNFRNNIEFIANSIGKKVNETSNETINRYISQKLFIDHIKMYNKKPIYWMFSSGEYEAFKCLIYMHKYEESTLSTINSKFLLPESARLKYELEETKDQITKADDKTRRILEKEKLVLENKYNEIIEYGQVLDHMANRYISIDLDDGVKVNYEKFQGIEIVTDSGTRIKKDLLIPIK
jgi:hypothetical protein